MDIREEAKELFNAWKVHATEAFEEEKKFLRTDARSAIITAAACCLVLGVFIGYILRLMTH